MAVERMDHVGVVVDDLDAATEFFLALGLELEGKAEVEGAEVDRVVGLAGVHSRFAFLRPPDGHGGIELIEFLSPSHAPGDPEAPPNAPGLRHLTFAVDDIDSSLAALRPHGAELVGEVVQYGDTYRLVYLRGPEGIIVELAERVG